MNMIKEVVDFVYYNLTGIFFYGSIALSLISFIFSLPGLMFYAFLLFVGALGSMLYDHVEHSWKEYKGRNND